MDQLDLDSSGFDPQRYVTHFLKSNSIQDLIRRNNSLQQEIKNYDSEIQSLVFQNYSRFISSIDTVKKMKSDIFKVDEKMRVLETSMNKITTLATHVDESLSVKRREIVKLHTIKMDLDKFNLLCRFPEILAADLLAYQTMVASNQVHYEKLFVESVNAYTTCFTKLEQFQHEQLVKQIYSDSIDKVEQIRTILWKCQNTYKPHAQMISRVHPTSHSPTSISTVELRAVTLKLVSMTTDQEPVIRNHLRMVKERLTAMTSHLINSSSAAATNIQHHHQQHHLKDDWDRLEAYAKAKKYTVSLRELNEFCESHLEDTVYKEGKAEGSMIWLVNSLISTVFADIQQEMAYLFIDLTHATENCAARANLIETALKDILVHVLDEIKKKMAAKHQLSSIEVGECFKNLARCMHDVVFANGATKRMLKTSVSDKFSELVEKVCRGQVSSLFGELRNEFLRLLIEAKVSCAGIQEDAAAALLSSNFAEAEARVYREISQVTSHVKNKIDIIVSYTCVQLRTVLFSPDVQYLQADDMFISQLTASMTDFVSFIPKIVSIRHHSVSQETFTLLTAMQGITPASKDVASVHAHELLKSFAATEEPSVYFLFAKQFLTVYKNKSIQKIYDALFAAIQPSVQQLARTQPGLHEFFEEEKSTIDMNGVRRAVSLCEHELSSNYINYIQSVSEAILSNLNAYFAMLSSKESIGGVTRVSDIVSATIGSRIQMILLELDLLFPDEKRGLSKKGTFVKNDNGMMIEMERLIVKKSRVFDLKSEQDFSRNSLLMSFIRSISKALIERVRRIPVLMSMRFQQLQVDLFFAIQLLFEMVPVDDESFVIAAYFEMIESAKHNAMEINLLDTPQLEACSSSARASIKI